ncbi:alkyl hydroperoxide reductase AhpD [Chitiniphilus shinanonensis]|uniref:Alkyl hydroperoxide reductase AhpD n=1 Tax=Chitiniphilus shinanonensis TaxID=553088 RepID=A0ABQ6BT04_9NEIS|nr:carboxymuconolactone decarboxylase family protein [Chitiniphilus shinanonensis]GLS05140.1 alkyl hydroperoxide reductase AhpD [Chitiniphilus shinanonensis]
MSLNPPTAYRSAARETYQALLATTATLQSGVLGESLIELVNLRVSQLNGCAYCVDMHARRLLALGHDWQWVNSVVTWHEVDFYDEAERAALAWAEAVTSLAQHGRDEDYAALVPHFDERARAELTFTIALMNAWNRMAIPLHSQVARNPAAPA